MNCGLTSYKKAYFVSTTTFLVASKSTLALLIMIYQIVGAAGDGNSGDGGGGCFDGVVL